VRWFPAPRRFRLPAGENYYRWNVVRLDSRPQHRHRSGDSHSRLDCQPSCRPGFHSGARRLVDGSARAEVAPLARAAAGIAGARTCLARRKAVAPTQAARSSTSGARETAPSRARKMSCGNAFSFHRYSAVILQSPVVDRHPGLQVALAGPRAPLPPELPTTHRICSTRRNSRARPNP